MMTTGIYIVDVHDGNHVDQISRYVVLAESTEDAERYVAAKQWPAATPEARRELILDRCTAGRLGTYDPGITGASLARTDFIAVQRMGQR